MGSNEFSMPEPPRWRRVLPGVLVLVALGFAALTVDGPLAQWFLAGGFPGEVRRAIHLCETFGHGFGVVMILLTVAVLDTRRWMLPRLVLASLGTGLTANVVKLFIARTRPFRADLQADILQTFLNSWPPGLRSSFLQSCPSAHTATAAGLAVGLSWMYPRGRWWFGLLAALVALQRMQSGSHFLSDTCWGAALGLLVATAFLHLPSLGYLGDKLEHWLGRPEVAHSPQSSASSRS